MLESKDSSQLVVARMLEFFADKSAWFRGLWEVGPILLIREALEATSTSPTGALFNKALEWTGNGFKSDEGILHRDRDILSGLLESSLHVRGGELPTLQRLTDRIESTYLEHWAEWLKNVDETKVKPERTARSVASHLLDAGFSPDFLHRWLTFLSVHDRQVYSLAEIVAKAHDMVTQPLTSYEVLVPVNADLGVKSLDPRDWRDAKSVSNWLTNNGFSSPLRQGGGWRLEVQARDAYSAAEQATGIVERLGARLLIGTGHKQSHFERAYVVENKPLQSSMSQRKEIRLRRRRRITVRSLERQEQLFRYSNTPSQVDAAFELIAQMDGPDVVAVAAGWAAIESLLTTPDSESKVESAERIAWLVACSFPRAELTLLASLQTKMGSSPLRAQLKGSSSNRERAILMAKDITSEQSVLSWEKPDQQAAVARMKSLLRTPKTRLDDIKAHANRAFRRLYRQRNLVLHAGKTNSVALSATLRTVAPLIGAGIDRIAHAWFVREVSPLELSVTAERRLSLLKDKNTDPAHLMDLLE